MKAPSEIPAADSYEGYFQKISALLGKTMKEMGIGMQSAPDAPPVFSWAAEAEPEMYARQDKAWAEVSTLLYEGRRAATFDVRHFTRFKEAMLTYGRICKPIFDSYKRAKLAGEFDASSTEIPEETAPAQLAMV